jgi:hypothetical protein
MEKEGEITWAEELLSRQERGFDHPVHLPTFRHVKIWLRKTRDRWPWRQIALEAYPKAPSVGAAISVVRRAVKAVNTFLASPLVVMVEKEKHKPSHKGRISSYLMACPPELSERALKEIRKKREHPWEKAKHLAHCDECKRSYEWAKKNAPWAIVGIPADYPKDGKPANRAHRITTLKNPKARAS